MDIEHPMIREIEKTGYPDREYLDWEREEEQREEVREMGAYDISTEVCPYCNEKMEADFVDVGVGMVQCGPYHCYNCGASEIGPELDDWCFKDREGKTIYLQSKRKYWSWKNEKTYFTDYSKSVLKHDAPFTSIEIENGCYQGGKISPYANTVAGQLVNHKVAKEAYDVGLLDEKIFKE